jgi:predicted negative regulator of RcsB-dependent stress response|tara:strand:- start:965 stop:1084 length:120 start_codon:yes stop_codon:yes gene_type:complete
MNKTIEKIKHYIKENLTALAWVIVIAVSMYYYVSLMFGD